MSRQIWRRPVGAYARLLLQRVLPRVVFGLGCLADLLDRTIEKLAGNTHRRVKSPSQPRRGDAPSRIRIWCTRGDGSSSAD